jgi:hypothetical protein
VKRFLDVMIGVSAKSGSIRPRLRSLQLAKQVAQSVVLAGKLIALFDQPAILGPLSVAFRPCRQHQRAQRSNIVGKGIGRGHGRDYPMSSAPCDPQPQGEST